MRHLDRFTQPPTKNGGSVSPALGERAVAVTNGAVTTILFTGDIFLQPPDSAGNAATADFHGYVEVELDADGDDIMIVAGKKGSALTPAFAANSGSNPGNVGRTIYNSVATGQPPRRIWFVAGSQAGENDSLFAISRTGAATLRYRVISSIPGTR
jgi:hypothetical protein